MAYEKGLKKPLWRSGGRGGVVEGVELRRKLVMGGMEAAIKYFEGDVEEWLDAFFCFYDFKINKSIIGWKSLSHRSKKGLPKSQWYTE